MENISIKELISVLDKLIKGEYSRSEVHEWALIKLEKSDNNQLEFYPPQDERQISETLNWLLMIDHIYFACENDPGTNYEVVESNVRIEPKGNQIAYYDLSMQEIQDYRELLSQDRA